MHPRKYDPTAKLPFEVDTRFRGLQSAAAADVKQILQGVIDTTLCYRYRYNNNGGKSQERQAVRARGS